MGFVKDYKLLEETHHTDDLFDVSFAVKRLDGLFRSVPNLSMILYVGPYGAGKSTAIHQLLTSYPKKTFLEFDAWKYPDRKDLWENFVLELARQFDEKTFKEFEKMLDGKQDDDKKALFGVVSGLIPGGDSLKEGMNYFLASSPATRTYQIQKILTQLITQKMKNKDVTIIIEDIDRAGDAGIFFLETLKTYLKTLDKKLNIKCIVPVSTTSFEGNPDSYLKCIDIIEYFRTPNPDLADFMARLLDEELFDDTARTQMRHFFDALFNAYQGQMSPRLLKQIMRAANSKYEVLLADYELADARIVIMCEAMKFLKRGNATTEQTVFQYSLQQRRVNDSVFCRLLHAIELDTDFEDSRVRKTDNIQYLFSSLTEPGHDYIETCVPWYSPDSNGPAGQWFIHDFYFNY